MSGRHRRARRGRLRLSFAPTLFLIAAVLMGATVVVTLMQPGERFRALGPSPCVPETLVVAAAPQIAPTLDVLARGWADTQSCVRVEVRSVDPAVVHAGLTDRPLPDVWIPDSSLWVDDVASAVRHPAIAGSPLVLAAAATGAAAVQALAARGWPDVMAASTVSVVDPAGSTDGLLAVLAARVTLGPATPAPGPRLVGALQGLARSEASTLSAGLDRVLARPGTALLTSEQTATTTAKGRLVSVAPPGAPPSFDFPVATFPAGATPARRALTDALVATLSDAASARSLKAAGFRTADRTTTPTPAAAQDAKRVWTVATRPAHSLVLTDLSAVPLDPRTGQPFGVAALAAAATRALTYLPDAASVGLWSGAAPVVPVGPLTAARRASLTSGFGALAAQEGQPDDVAAALLAAYTQLRADYDPAGADSIVLITTGLGPLAGPARNALSSRAAAVPGRPLPLHVVVLGTGGDLTALRRIAAASGGDVTVAADGADAGQALERALVGSAV